MSDGEAEPALGGWAGGCGAGHRVPGPDLEPRNIPAGASAWLETAFTGPDWGSTDRRTAAPRITTPIRTPKPQKWPWTLSGPPLQSPSVAVFLDVDSSAMNDPPHPGSTQRYRCPTSRAPFASVSMAFQVQGAHAVGAVGERRTVAFRLLGKRPLARVQRMEASSSDSSCHLGFPHGLPKGPPAADGAVCWSHAAPAALCVCVATTRS